MDGAARAVVAAYVPPAQQQFLERLKGMEYWGLLEDVDGAEVTAAVARADSRTSKSTGDWKSWAMQLLLYTDRRVLVSLVDGTLPQLAQIDGSLEGWKYGGVDKNCEGEVDPVIYVNFIADHNGKGLSCNDFEYFLGAFEAVVAVEQGPRDGYQEQGLSLMEGVDKIFGRNFLDSLEATDAHATQRDPKAGFKRLRDNVGTLVRVYRDEIIPAARSAGVDHIMFKGEVGWSSKGYDRCRQYAEIKSSPAIFALAQCVVRHLFISRRFQLHQFVVFGILNQEEPAVGESMASQLCGSHITCGGFNIARTGISAASAEGITLGQWEALRNTFYDKYDDRMQKNFMDVGSVTKRTSGDAEAAIRRHKLEEEAHEAEQALAIQEEVTDLKLKSLEAAIEDSERIVTALNRRVDEHAARSERDERLERAMRELAEGLGVLTPSTPPEER